MAHIFIEESTVCSMLTAVWLTVKDIYERYGPRLGSAYTLRGKQKQVRNIYSIYAIVTQKSPKIQIGRLCGVNRDLSWTWKCCRHLYTGVARKVIPSETRVRREQNEGEGEWTNLSDFIRGYGIDIHGCICATCNAWITIFLLSLRSR